MKHEFFENKERELLLHGEPVMSFVYRESDISVYRQGLEYFMIDYPHEVVREIDYKDLETIRALLLNCNIKFD